MSYISKNSQKSAEDPTASPKNKDIYHPKYLYGKKLGLGKARPGMGMRLSIKSHIAEDQQASSNESRLAKSKRKLKANTQTNLVFFLDPDYRRENDVLLCKCPFTVQPSKQMAIVFYSIQGKPSSTHLLSNFFQKKW